MTHLIVDDKVHTYLRLHIKTCQQLTEPDLSCQVLEIYQKLGRIQHEVTSAHSGQQIKQINVKKCFLKLC